MSTTEQRARAQRRRADRERIEQAAQQLLSSEGWQRWVRVRATNGLARYSFHNQLLITLQRPDATYVAGFRAFLALNRCVRKGERAIRILAPMSVKVAPEAAEQQTPADPSGPRRTVFRAVPVFDVAQTEPPPDREPVALQAPAEPIQGDSHAALLPTLVAFAGELGYSVSTLAMDGGADGWCDARAKRIAVNAAVSQNAQVRVLVHELAHALGIGYEQYGRHRAEVLVDTVTFIVCGSIGLDTSGSTVPYIAGWGEDGALEAIRCYAQRIDEIARRIENAVCPAPPQPTAPDATA
jgi:N-terminal domain of anti-restriction factor ArdC